MHFSFALSFLWTFMYVCMYVCMYLFIVVGFLLYFSITIYLPYTPLSPKHIFFKKIYFIDYVITVVLIYPPLPSSTQYSPFSLAILPLSSCLWVMHISSLVTLFPIPFLTSPSLLCTYQFVFFKSLYIFPHSPPFPLLMGNHPNELHIYDFFP